MHRLLLTITGRDFTYARITGHLGIIRDTDLRDIIRAGTIRGTDLRDIIREGTIRGTDLRDIILVPTEETGFTIRHFPDRALVGGMIRISVQNRERVQAVPMVTDMAAVMEEVSTDVSPYISA